MPDAPKPFGPAVQLSFGVANLKLDPLSCDLTQVFWPVKLVISYSPGEDAASTLTRVFALQTYRPFHPATAAIDLHPKDVERRKHGW